MAEANIQYDGFISLIAGQHSGLAPHLLQESYFWRGINVSNRDGVVSTRPGFTKLSEFVPPGAYRGGGTWSLDAGDYLVCVTGTRITVFDYVNLQFTNFDGLLTGTGLCHFTQVDRWLVVQDGISRPVVLEETSSATRTVAVRLRDVVRDGPFTDDDAKICLVPGTIGLYLHQRYHYVAPDVPLIDPLLDSEDPDFDVLPTASGESGRTSFVSSDVKDVYNPEYVFRMSEHRVVNEGGANGLPQELGFITGMSFLRGAQTGTGYGPMLVFSRKGLSAFDVGSPRTQWKDIAISQVLFSGAGTLSEYALTPVNTDVFYVDSVGYLRSIRYDATRLTGGSALYNTPISNEMRHFCEHSKEESLPYASSALADNRLFWTLRGEAAEFSFPGIGVLDFAPVYGMGGASDPAFQGVWTGFDFVQVFSPRVAQLGGIEGLVAVVRTAAGLAILYLDPDATKDCGSTLIRSVLMTRAYNFQSPVQAKVLRRTEAWLADIREHTSLSTYYRPYGHEAWTLAGSRQFYVGGTNAPQFRRRIQTPVSDTNAPCALPSRRKVTSADDFQFALVWEGYSRIDRFRAGAEYYMEEPERLCAEDNPDRVDPDTTVPEVLEDFSYEVTAI